MTEAEWLQCPDTEPLLRGLADEGLENDRKLRLFALACVRRIWHLLPSECSRTAVEVGERFVEGQASEAELNEAYQHASSVTSWEGFAAARILLPADSTSCSYNAGAASQVCDFVHMSVGQDQVQSECEAQIKLLWDVMGNPFRPVAVDQCWLAWKDGTAVKLAQAIYHDRAFDRLLVLADALEEAGCDNAEILAHCRQPGEHVRGCWVVDLVLGKE